MDLKDNGAGGLFDLLNRGFFIKHQWVGDRYITKNPGIIISKKGGTEFDIIQETGAGKTILGIKQLYMAHIRGRNIGANIKVKWTKPNINKNDKKRWMPTLRSMEDIETASNQRVLIDDIYGTCEAWNTKESKMLSVVTLVARKAWLDMDITSQFLQNQIPPNLQRVCGEYHIPFINVEDKTRISPDGKHYTPLQMLDLVFTSNRVFKYCKVLNLNTDTGYEILNGFDTLEIATSLNVDGESRPNCNQVGFELEAEAFDFLKEKLPGKTWQHLDGKKVFDIICEDIAIDVVGTDEDANLRTEHKNMLQHIRTAEKKGQIPYLMFKWRGSWGFKKIDGLLIQRHKGEKIDTYKMKVLIFAEL